MLKSWLLQNFKPILDSGELKLAPVTVLAGRNSSGKSSLIQSILMIAQTLSSRIVDRALLPNGPVGSVSLEVIASLGDWFLVSKTEQLLEESKTEQLSNLA
ncbi:MAG: AAA family ATPase [Ktedonobacteraceae bacterium]|nr:AAA family ATPase [Ktedonobacteraceae bacterium]